MFEYPLEVLASGTPVAGRSSKLGCSAALSATSPPTIMTEPLAMTIAEGYQRGTWRESTPASSCHSFVPFTPMKHQ